MITTLLPLAKTHGIQIIIDADKEGNLTVTVLLKPKGEKDGEVIPLQFMGTAEEIEASITADLGSAVTKLVTHGNNLAELDKQLAEVEAEKKKTVEKKKAEPAPKPAAAKSKPKPAAKKPAATKSVTKALAKKAAPAKAPAKPGLTRPPTSKPVEPAPVVAPESPAEEVLDLGDLLKAADSAPATAQV